MQLAYTELSKVMFNIRRIPASTSAVEGNHKVNINFQNSLRCKVDVLRMENQISVVYKNSHISPNAPQK